MKAKLHHSRLDPIPQQILEGELVVLAGLFCGPQAPTISVLLPAYDSVDDVRNLAINVKCKITDIMGSGQRFEAQLRAPRGTFHVTVLPALEGDSYRITAEIRQIEVMSACAGKLKQIWSRIFPERNIIMTTSIEEPLSYKTFNKITPRTFSALMDIYNDILLTERVCTKVVQLVSSELITDNQVWQVILELPEELFRLHGICYQVLRPFDQRRLLDFLPARMWDSGFRLLYECLRLHPETLYKFLDKAMLTLKGFQHMAPEFEPSWNFMITELHGLRCSRTA
jgi:hypothetical protein